MLSKTLLLMCKSRTVFFSIALSALHYSTKVDAAVLVVAESLVPGPTVNGGSSTGVGGLYGVGGDSRTYHNFLGQTFIANYDGYLHSASFVIINHMQSTVGNDLTVSITKIVGDAPEFIVDSGSISYSSVPVNSVVEQPYRQDYSVTVIFSGEAVLVAGQRYSLTIGSLGDLGSHYRIWMPNVSNPYLGGSKFENKIDGIVTSASQDLFFRIEAQTIPEPASSSIFGIGALLGLLAIRRR